MSSRLGRFGWGGKLEGGPIALLASFILGLSVLAFALAGPAKVSAAPRHPQAGSARAGAGLPAARRYAWATSFGIIGLNPDYVMAKLGPPRRRSRTELDYDIGDCAIFFAVRGTEVTGFTALIDRKCHPDLDGSPLTERTTFGDLMRGNGTFFADCVALCGNAHDAYVAWFERGGHAQDYISTLYSSVELDGARGDPSGDWERDIRRRHGLGADDIPADERIFHCVTDPPPAVVAGLRTARIEAVQVGRHLEPERCDS